MKLHKNMENDVGIVNEIHFFQMNRKLLASHADTT